MRRDPRRSFLSYAGTAIYAVFLVVASFEHHDLLCHLKTPQHCTACTSSQLSTNPHSPTILAECTLADAGHADVFQPTVKRILLAVRSTGRSPPF
jgi:hypothetical protein